VCGICGVAEPGAGPPERELVDAMAAALRHRGPDGGGRLLRPGLALGVRRLSIIDLAGGNQPISSEDGALSIVFNGEVYNHRELRAELEGLGHRFSTRADTEAVVHAWEQWGPDALARLNGMFAFALWDERRRELLLARDRLGIKPLYYSLRGGRLLFGSELKALLRDPTISREVDPAAPAQYLAPASVPAPPRILRDLP